MKVASIDIGSNTILMQIVEKTRYGEIQIIAEFQRFARLAENLKLTGKVSDNAIVRAQKIMTLFSDICEEFSVDIVAAVATSAVREAVNSKQVVQKLETSFNANRPKNNHLTIKTITGNEEAELAYRGTCFNDVELNTIIDIGGGSTEIITGQDGHIINKISIPIGVVKLTEDLHITQPLSNYKALRVREHIKKQLAAVNKNNFGGRVIAVSGTPTTLVAIHLNLKEFDVSQINNFEFTRDVFSSVVSSVLQLELNTLTHHYGLEKYRADVLSAGTLMLDEIIKYLGKDSFTVSTSGLRHGLALQAIADYEKQLYIQL